MEMPTLFAHTVTIDSCDDAVLEMVQIWSCSSFVTQW